jgi:diaminopimelate epimerase
VRLSKHHGLGNDFLVVLDERNDVAPVIDGASAVALCDRRRGIGADGLIHGAAPDPEQVAPGIDVVMHLFNADGSRAEISGNGIRCLAQAVARQRGASDTTVVAATDAGIRTLAVSATEDPAVCHVRVEMGEPRPGPTVPQPVEELLGVRHGTVDMGNPHLVVLVDDPASVDLATEGPWLESQFAGGVNVEYVAVRDAGATIELRVWERGAGITEACGSGACAATFQAAQWGLVGDRVQVAMPGGTADVELVDGEAVLIGPSVLVADIDLLAEGVRA